tara:strand:+ start:158 stop:631 length:474 start_codon:yes stop_codon:yes gene_type:complete
MGNPNLCIIFLASLLFLTLSLAEQEALIVPSTELTPTDVVRIQIAALQSNDDPYADAGISLVFSFASPSNRRNTGPVNRFAHMIKESYGAMLYHVQAEFSKAEILGNQARVGVILTTPEGIRHGFMFILSKQLGGEYSGMWMTDTVFRFNVSQPRGT